MLDLAVDVTDKLASSVPQSGKGPRIAGAVAITTVIFALSIPALLNLHGAADFFAYFPAVIISVFLGGVLGGVASVCTALFWISLTTDLDVFHIDTIGFTIVSTIIVLLVETLQRRQIRDLAASEQRHIERSRNEAQIAILSEEVAHRCKNLLAVVVAIADNSWDQEKSSFSRQIFSDRVRALARSHDLLEESGWAAIPLRESIEGQLAHITRGLSPRILMSGPDFKINAAAAQAISMAMYELATNATKYGALSNSAGYVDLRWRITDTDLEINWTELNGPIVSPPSRFGFGQKVIKKYLEHSLDASIDLKYVVTGVQWSMSAPLRVVVAHRWKHDAIEVNSSVGR